MEEESIIIKKENKNVDFVYLMGYNSKEELGKDVLSHIKDGYEIIGEHKIGIGCHVEYSARMMKVVK